MITAFGDPRIQLYENHKDLGMAGNWDRALLQSQGQICQIIVRRRHFVSGLSGAPDDGFGSTRPRWSRARCLQS